MKSNIKLNKFNGIILIILFVFASHTALAQKKIKPGQTFRDCPTCPEMVVIPAGSFTMGSPPNEIGLSVYSDSEMEATLRRVTVPSFAVAKFVITRGQWAAFVAATNRPITGGCIFSGLPDKPGTNPWDPNPDATWNNLGFPQDDNHPVVCINWEDTQDYVQWLSKKTGASYRLLSEAEFEYAARAGTTTAYPWGDSASHEFANYGNDTVAGTGFIYGSDKWMYTSPVGAFPANQFGLYDMHGNVMEWVEDCFSMSYAGLATDGSANHATVILKMKKERLSFLNGISSCSLHMVRGGCYADPPAICRSASRNMGPAGGFMKGYDRSAGGSFRVARTL